MPARLLPLRNPISISLDGDTIQAEDGEPLAAALLGAEKTSFARSPKFHRPRGPACMRAACDGCLARVDGVPNVMTCVSPARQGSRVEVQNTLGSREVDLLRVTDWFFPEGFDHHHLFAGVPGVQRVMQAFARRVAGLGLLPTDRSSERPPEIPPPRAAMRRAQDVVVVGAGPAGIAVASALALRGRSVELLDDGLVPGGGLRSLAPGDLGGWRALEQGFERARATGLVVRPSTVAGGLYGEDLLVVGPEGAEVVTARALVLATGAHDGVLAFEGNDLPGVMSARAGGMLARLGVRLGPRVVVVIAPGGGPFGESFARAMTAAGAGDGVVVVRGVPVSASGSSKVRSVTVREGEHERSLDADALLIDAPRAPAYELPEQAGARILHEPRGFVARAPRGKIRGEGDAGVWVVGEAAGDAFDPAVITRAAEDVVDQVAAGR